MLAAAGTEKALDAALHLGANLTDESFQAQLLAELKRTGTKSGIETVDGILVPTKDILTALNTNKETPWADLKNGLTAEKLAKTLRGYDVKPVHRRAGSGTGDKPTVRGYFLHELEALFARWLPSAADPSEPGTPDTPPADQVIEPLPSVSSPNREPDAEKHRPGTSDTELNSQRTVLRCRLSTSDEFVPRRIIQPDTPPIKCQSGSGAMCRCTESKEGTDGGMPPYRYVVTEAASPKRFSTSYNPMRPHSTSRRSIPMRS